MLFAAREFAKEGFSVAAVGFELAPCGFEDIIAESASEALAGADFAVLPPVVSRDGENVHAPLSREKIRFGGLDFGAAKVFTGVFFPKTEAKTRCYAEREAFAVRNAVPTAEGALKIAMEQTCESICGMHACVLGFGRIGAVLTKDLLALGASVEVFARRSEARALAASFGAGAHGFDSLPEKIGSYDCVFNTVPQRIAGEAELCRIKEGAPFIELASAPGGADEALARSLGVKYIPAGGLPGKIMPKSAGKIVYETIKEMMEEEEKI